MTQANITDLNDPIYAQLLAKIALLEQENQQLTEQHQQEKQQIQQQYHQQTEQIQQHYQQQAEQTKQQYETKLAELYQQLQTAIERQNRLIHQLFGQSSEKLTAKQNRLNQETALEDLASLEQLQDNFIDGLTNDEKAKLQATFNIRLETTENGNSSQFADGETSTTADKPTKPKRPKNPVIPNDLDIKEIIHSPNSTTCDCGCQMRHIGDDVQDKLGIVPKRFYIQRHIYPKWVCSDCQTLVQAHAQKQIINKSIATPELLAHILISKYADHLPLYRQSLIYQRSGVNIPDSTLADWVGRCGVALEPLVKRLHELMLKQDILHADETPVTIMKHNSNTPKQGYVWAYITPQHITVPNGFRAVIYDFAESRKNEHPNAFLQGWKGKLICDDYNGYKQLFNKQGVTEIGCMAHARRKFFDLHQQKTSHIAHEALDYIGQLYGIEREIDEQFEKNSIPIPRDPSVVRQIRQDKAKPIADKLYEWLQQRRQQVNKNSPITNALDYCLKRWTALTRYLDDGRLPIDNNWAENQMRPWALGRKNWLFAGSLRSGQRAANIMSIIQSARLNGLDPYAYLSDVLKRLPTHDADIDDLLPHRWSLSV